MQYAYDTFATMKNFATRFFEKNMAPRPYTISILYTSHSSEIRGLHLMKLPSEMFQNFLYFMYKKTHVVFYVFHFVQLYIFTL